MRTKKYKPTEIIEAVKKHKGFLSLVANHLNCSLQTIHNYRNRYPEIAQAINEERERFLDFAENKLLEHIQNGDITALIFFLKTQGRHRGYSEKAILTINNELNSLNVPQDVLNELTYIETNSKHTD